MEYPDQAPSRAYLSPASSNCASKNGMDEIGKTPITEPTSAVSVFERYLTVWVFLCIVAGVALGQFFPGVFQAVGAFRLLTSTLPWWGF